MKYRLVLVALFSFLLLSSANIFAQEKEMTEEEWTAEMQRLKDKQVSLQNEINTLNSDIQSLRNTPMPNTEDCQTQILRLIGATAEDVNNFRTAINELNNKINRKEGPKADRQKDLDALKMNRISAMIEFYDKVHNQMQRSIDSWVEEPTEINYTVVRGDHLWGIAKRPEHYGNPFAWPNIYKANRDQIKNPDLIFPKQIFKIPNLTEEEKSKYEKLRKNYKPAPVQ